MRRKREKKYAKQQKNDSVLFFDERYDENINWNMWHVRSRDWWREKLPNWQLIFLDINIAEYPSGIYGIKVTKENIINVCKPK